jgi:hypothetical protein
MRFPNTTASLPSSLCYESSLFTPFFIGQNNLIPRFQQERLLQEIADPYLGAGKIRHDHALALKVFHHGMDAPNVLAVAVQGTVGEVEPRHIHAQQHQPFQDSLRSEGRPDGADDFGFMGRQSHGLCSSLFINS